MTAETLENTVLQILSQAEVSAGFAFQGGEPTLAGLDFYKELLEIERKHNKNGVRIYNSIQTNGLEIDDEWAGFLSENRFLTGVSLDGTREIHNKYRRDKSGAPTWDRALSAADKLRAHGAEYSVLCVVTPECAKNPELVYKTLKKHVYMQFIPCLELSDEKKRSFSPGALKYAEFLDRIFDMYYTDRKNGVNVSVRLFDNYAGMIAGRPPESCGITGKCVCSGVVESDGDVYPCDFYCTDEYLLGNVNDADLNGFLTSDRARSFVYGSYTACDECSVCAYGAFCGGGCRRERDEYGKYRYCDTVKRFFGRNYKKLCELSYMFFR